MSKQSNEISKQMSKQLAKCPFCGGEAKLNVIEPHIHVFAKMPDYHGGAFIECSKCTCAMSGETSEEVIKAWNTRKQLERAIKHLEKEGKFADEEKERCAMESIFQFDRANGYATGIYNAIEIIKEELM